MGSDSNFNSGVITNKGFGCEIDSSGSKNKVGDRTNYNTGYDDRGTNEEMYSQASRGVPKNEQQQNDERAVQFYGRV